MNIKLLTEHHFEFVSLKGGCTGLSESTLVKMPHCWKHMSLLIEFVFFSPTIIFVLASSEDPDMWHFIWVFTV